MRLDGAVASPLQGVAGPGIELSGVELWRRNPPEQPLPRLALAGCYGPRTSCARPTPRTVVYVSLELPCYWTLPAATLSCPCRVRACDLLSPQRRAIGFAAVQRHKRIEER